MAVSRSAIMLGSQPIGRLGTLVNWSNSKSFQVELDAPWAFQEAEESAIATDLKNAEPMALATGNAPEPLPSKSDETLVPAPPAAIADIAVKIPEPEASPKNAEPMALATGDASGQLPSDSDRALVPTPPAANIDDSVRRTGSSGQPVIKKLDTAPTFKPPADSNKSKPVTSRVSQTMLPQPAAVQPNFAAQSTDAYVQQLEQLVIELNCELGMAIAPPTADNTNPTAWLMQRMIQLNLQNLELKEKLRQNYS